MKIVLIYPPFIEERIHAEDILSPPIGIFSVGAILKENGYGVEIWNMPGELLAGISVPIEKRIKELRADILGFSVLHGNRWPAIDIARITKRLLPNVKVVFGGVGATFLWRHLLEYFPEIDYVVTGEGEYSFLELVRHIEKGTDEPPRHIRGVAFNDRRGRPYWSGPSEPIRDLDALPIPAKFFDYQHVSSTRGCAWKCRFCGSPAFWNGRVRYRSPENFVYELELLIKKGRNILYFSDDNFTIKKERAIEICKLIIEKGLNIRWYAISRVDRVDEEIIYWMRRAGCIQISYGVESGSAEVRRALGKPLERRQIRKAFSITKRYGILPRAYFIYGAPGEDKRVIEETIELIKEIKPLSVIFYILDVFPGTELYNSLKSVSLISDDYWLKRTEGVMYFYFENDPPVTEHEILDRGEMLRSAFYQSLPEFVESIKLVDRKELYRFHADFLSRLAMTFSHGDYSHIAEIKAPEQIAEKLYHRALSFAPDNRAYLGLGIIRQKRGDYDGSLSVLQQGMMHFPKSEELHKCAKVSESMIRRR